ncbi:acyltransferase family protein [Pseudarthrobacter sp. ATCC 49987]|uniref:acyltransferase family protein n=1 Tax=Pseudarthrobacter sp. ATCC 49987 TaxID=2698204 RepID=UPI00136FAE4A|nr:acyltransferase [Pseudarthrobacter sp. ATCC 49987]
MTSPAATPRRHRLRSLDGCRGIAALIVLIHHSALTVPEFANLYLGNLVLPKEGSLLWWLNGTPLKVFTAGGEAVLLFFVLSGLVVSLPVLRARQFDWVAYFFTRTIRLWVPVAASLVLAAICLSIAVPDANVAVSKWVTLSNVPVPEWQEVVRGFDAVRGPTRINNPLWSLQWEFLFSLLLPVFVGIAVVLRRWAAATITLCTGFAAIGYLHQIEYLVYFSAFLAGALIAFTVIDRPRKAAKAGTSFRGQLVWFAVFVAGILLMCAYWMLFVGSVSDHPTLAFAKSLSIPGAVLIVLSAVFSRPVCRLLELPPVQWLGRISFSLYLVHVPILVLFSRMLGSDHWMRALLFAVPTTFVVAWLFSRIIEVPSHRLAKWTGSLMSGKVSEVITRPPARKSEPLESGLEPVINDARHPLGQSGD